MTKSRFGGRKFLLALLAIGVGTAIELLTDRGLSVPMAGLLGTIVAAFQAANYAVTREYARKSAQQSVASKAGGEEVKKTVVELADKVNKIGDALVAVGQTAANTNQILQAAAQKREL